MYVFYVVQLMLAYARFYSNTRFRQKATFKLSIIDFDYFGKPGDGAKDLTSMQKQVVAPLPPPTFFLFFSFYVHLRLFYICKYCL